MLIKANEYLERLGQFGDSFELAETLREMAEDTSCSVARYNLNECAEHIEGLYKLAMSAPVNRKGESE